MRVPVVTGHSESVHAQFHRPMTAVEASASSASAPGVVLIDEPLRARQAPAAARTASATDAVFVGRVRDDLAVTGAINLWIVADNLRKGAALNAVQIAELLVRTGAQGWRFRRGNCAMAWAMDLRFPVVLALTTLTAACGHKNGDAAPADSGSPAASAAKPAAASAVDPKIAAMAKAAVACKAYDSSFDSSCPAMKAWSDAKDDFNEGKADASLVAMLGDGDEKVRYLGAYKLNQYGKAFKTDKALAERVIAAAEKEKSKFTGFELGSTVGRVLVRETGTFDRVKAMAKKHDVPDVRRGILSQLLFSNQDYDPVYGLVRDTIKDPDKAVASQALSAFWVGGSRKSDDTCQIYVDNIDNPDDNLASEASNALSWCGRCAPKYDALIASLEKRVKAGPGAVASPSYATAARHVCEDAKATDAQKKKAAEIGRGIAGKKDFKAWVRTSALETVVKCDTGNGGRSFVGKFKGDAEKSVADKAKELLAKK